MKESGRIKFFFVKIVLDVILVVMSFLIMDICDKVLIYLVVGSEESMVIVVIMD